MSDDPELVKRHIEAAKRRKDEAEAKDDWEAVAREAKNIVELRRRLGDDSSSGTSGDGKTSGAGDVVERMRATVTQQQRDAELFHDLSGPDKVRLYREDPDRFKKLADAYRDEGMRKLLGR